jgi:hypothetical protein
MLAIHIYMGTLQALIQYLAEQAREFRNPTIIPNDASVFAT